MSEYVDMPFFCIISYSRLDTFDTFKHGSFYLLYIFIISSFSTDGSKNPALTQKIVDSVSKLSENDQKLVLEISERLGKD